MTGDASSCPVCNTKFDVEAQVTSEIEITCPECGAEVPEDMVSCVECGTRVKIEEHAELEETEEPVVEEVVGPEVIGEPKEAVVTDIDEVDPDSVEEELVELIKLPGVGHLKAKLLYEAGYTDLRKLKRASVVELMKVRGIGRKSAGEIKAELRGTDIEEIRSHELTEETIEREFQCPLCGIILSEFESSCYGCGTSLKKVDEVGEDEDNLALSYYDSKLMKEPNSAELWYARGATLLKMDDNEKALESFDRALEFDPAYQPAWISKAELYNKMGEPLKAAECFSKIVTTSTEMAEDEAVIVEEMAEPDTSTDVVDTEPITIEVEEQAPESVEEEPVIEESTEEEPAPEPEPEVVEVQPEPEIIEEPEPVPEPEVTVEEETAPGEESVPEPEPEVVEVQPEVEPEPTSTVEETVEEEVVTEPEPVPEPEPEVVEAEEKQPAIEPELEIVEEPVHEPEPIEEPEPAPAITELQDIEPDIPEEEEEDDGELPTDPKELRKLLSKQAARIKPLLLLAKDVGMDINEQKIMIANGVRESKKGNLDEAIAIMREGKKGIENSLLEKLKDDLKMLAQMARDSKASGQDIGPSIELISEAKKLLVNRDYKGSFGAMNKCLQALEGAGSG